MTSLINVKKKKLKQPKMITKNLPNVRLNNDHGLI
jgi:hypothetical protein